MNTTRVPACPDSEVVGAFVEGRSGAEERAEMIRHLDRCEPCRQEVAVLAEFVAAGRPAERATRSGWWLAAAASLVTVVGIGLWMQGRTGDRDGLPVAPLVAATAPLEYRLVEPRLSGGFGWAEFREPVRSSTEAHDPKLLKLKGAAGDVLQEAEANPTARKTHAAAIAMLLLEDPAHAIEALTKVTAERPNDARAWSDLAAAHHASAIRYDRPADEPSALAAADRAIRINPKLTEAHFNRALILEHLGVTLEARDAWTKYLELDSTSEWAREARAHLDALSRPTAQSLFHAQKSQLERDALAGNTRAVRAFVERFPQQSRATAEVETLGRWGEAIRSDRTAEAERLLITPRAVGDALRARAAEELLADLVAAIDRASPDERTRLANAHATYRDGRIAQSQGKVGVARAKLLMAARLFSGSAGSLNARYFAAVVSGQAGDIDVAERELGKLFALTPGLPRYKALHAQIARECGLMHGRRARWPESLESYRIARDLFAEIGERENAAVMTAMTAEALMMLGRPNDAWDAWSASFRTLSEEGLERDLATQLTTASRLELIAGRADTSSSLLDLGMRFGRKTGALKTDLLFRSAMLSARVGDSTRAAATLGEAERAATTVEDPVMRRNLLADMQVAEGVAVAASDPRRGLELLTVAVAHHRTARRVLLPVALFERARVLRVLGRDDDAERDLHDAIAAAEEHRESIEWRDTRSLALDGVDQIYTTLAELLLQRGRTREAFAAADRAAAHGFYGANAAGSLVSADTLQKQLVSGSAVVEYLVLPRQLVIFFVDAHSFETRIVPLERSDVVERVAALDRALRARAAAQTVRAAAARLHAALIAPIRELLATADALSVIPDPAIASVPFAALCDANGGRWLIEDYSIRIVPTALYRSPPAHSRGGAERVVLIRPSAGNNLPRTGSETAAILNVYPSATLIEGNSTTVDTVLEAIRDANVIHYAGHADSERDSGLVLHAANGTAGMLYGADVVRNRLRGAPLVVLAGCATLRGGGRRDDLASSLTRAFLLAGARAVVGTSWDVTDDAAAALFARFHELNAAIGDPVAALRDAQRSMLHEPHRNVADWASAQIVVRSLDI